MLMMILDNFFDAQNCKITYLDVTSREILAPDSFVCSDGKVLFDRLFYIKKGGMQFTLNNGQKVTFGEKSIIYLPYNITYSSKWLENGQFISVNFILKQENSQLLHFYDNITLVLTDTYNELIKTFEEIWNAQIKISDEHHLLTISLFYMILYKIVKTSNIHHIKKEHGRIYPAIKYLESNYASDFDLAELAEKCNLSREMFRIYFIKTKGVPPMRYRTLLRLEKANELLLSKEYSVKEVSNIVGYNDVSYFSRIFKKEYGYPPVELLNS